jgi:hypothetical protein
MAFSQPEGFVEAEATRGVYEKRELLRLLDNA